MTDDQMVEFFILLRKIVAQLDKLIQLNNIS